MFPGPKTLLLSACLCWDVHVISATLTFCVALRVWSKHCLHSWNSAVAPDAINDHVKTYAAPRRNLHYISPEYGELSWCWLWSMKSGFDIALCNILDLALCFLRSSFDLLRHTIFRYCSPAFFCSWGVEISFTLLSWWVHVAYCLCFPGQGVYPGVDIYAFGVCALEVGLLHC